MYTGIEQVENTSLLDQIKEEVKNTGFSILENFLSDDWVSSARKKVLDIYALQEKEFTLDSLININDYGIARNLVDYDPIFLDLVENEFIDEIAKVFLGEVYVLSLSNAIINRHDVKNCQSRWHRDFPYQNFIADELLGLNFLIPLDDFTMSNGATELLSHSNKLKKLPSIDYIDKHAIKAKCPKGGIIIFDSMLFHRAGINFSDQTRVGINLNFVRPFIKQQYEMEVTQYGRKSKLFGVKYFSSKGQREFRDKRLKAL